MVDQGSLFSQEVLSPRGEKVLAIYREKALACTACALAQARTQVVFGKGNPDGPDIAFVGEGPGSEEDRKGEPFVGPAGKLLNDALKKIEVEREHVFITNIVLCRPPNNRKPEAKEIGMCRTHLVGQLRSVQPKVIVALGATAVEGLTGKTDAISKLRGKWLKFENTPVMPTFHPAYLLRSPDKKPDFLEDMIKVLVAVGRPIPKR